jgi:hypothetical protein
VVLGTRPAIAADTATGLVPEPGEGVHGALDPYAVVVPYSNLHSVTSLPSGFTVALRVAELEVIDDADPVVRPRVRGSVLKL